MHLWKVFLMGLGGRHDASWHRTASHCDALRRRCDALRWRCDALRWRCDVPKFYAVNCGFPCDALRWHCDALLWHCVALRWDCDATTSHCVEHDNHPSPVNHIDHTGNKRVNHTKKHTDLNTASSNFNALAPAPHTLILTNTKKKNLPNWNALKHL